MFVVHTVNQLEEAVRVGAEEILVTGVLANNVHEAYLLKTYKDKDVAEIESLERQQGNGEMDTAAHRSGVPLWGTLSMMILAGEYILLDSHLDSRSPSMILQRTTQH